MGTFNFIKSCNVMDIQGAAASFAPIDAFPQKTTGTDGRLWEFVRDPAGSGAFPINSKLTCFVAEIQGVLPTSGEPLDLILQTGCGPITKDLAGLFGHGGRL